MSEKLGYLVGRVCVFATGPMSSRRGLIMSTSQKGIEVEPLHGEPQTIQIEELLQISGGVKQSLRLVTEHDRDEWRK